MILLTIVIDFIFSQRPSITYPAIGRLPLNWLGFPAIRVIEGSNAEVGLLIADITLASFLTPDMASKNDARHGIGFS